MASINVRGIEFFFDEGDLPIVNAHSWWVSPQGYACTKVRWPDGRLRTIAMHRLILGDPPTPSIDHINRVRSDNRRANLRACTDSENNRNRPTVIGKRSAHRGVSRSKKSGLWQVVVRTGGRLRWIGQYVDERMAASVAAPYFDGIAQ